MEFFEFDDRLIAIRNAGAEGWAFGGGFDGTWRPVSPTFAGQVYFEGIRISEDEAKTKFGFDPTSLPA